jgi:signal transduction histidine kinase
MTLLQQFAESATGSTLPSEFRRTRLVLTGLFALLLGLVLFFNMLHTFETARSGFEGFELPAQSDIIDPRGWRINPALRDQLELSRSEALRSVRLSAVLSSTGILILLTTTVWMALYYLLKPLADSVREKEKFVSQASHELRTPLAIMYSDLSLASTSNNKEDLREAITSSVGEIKRLQQLSDTLLGRVQAESRIKVALAPVINKIVSDLASYNHNKMQITVDIPAKASLVSNEHQLHQLLYSIVENAIKHGKEDGMITITYNNKRLTISNDTDMSEYIPGMGVSVAQDLALHLDLVVEYVLSGGIFSAIVYKN